MKFVRSGNKAVWLLALICPIRFRKAFKVASRFIHLVDELPLRTVSSLWTGLLAVETRFAFVERVIGK